MNCSNCEKPLGGPGSAAAGISVLAQGNEVIHSYFRCDSCGMWTVEHYEDEFTTGDTDIWRSGPLTEVQGARCIELVARCPNPHDKLCGCQSHVALYTGVPGGND